MTVDISSKGLFQEPNDSRDRVAEILWRKESHDFIHSPHSQNVSEQVRSLPGVNPAGLEQIQTWNSRLQLQKKNSCIHEVVAQRCQEQPHAVAVCAWDGTMTYSELDAQSSSLANNILASRKLRLQSFVGLLFRKSMWTPVAMMAVMKAGCAFVLLDPSLPDQRLQTLCRVSRAVMVLTSPGESVRASRLGPVVVVVGHKRGASKSTTPPTLWTVKPHRAAYATFTSGSTEEPKGVVVEHTAVCSGVEAYCASVGLDGQSRCLQFASYSLTISVVDHLIALMQGACLCIPSEDQLKNNLVETLRGFDVNWIILTPSVARVLEPKAIPSLRTLCLACESITRSDLEKWRGRLHLKSIYGQFENALPTLVDTKGHSSDPSDLGHAFAAKCWIVHSQDHNRLVPIGAEGELLIEAPTMSRGYLNDEKTATFIHDPEWLQDIRPGEHGRFLRTGDIVRYRPQDGSIQYVGHGSNSEASESSS